MRPARLAQPVAAIMADELGRPIDEGDQQAFIALARRYRTVP